MLVIGQSGKAAVLVPFSSSGWPPLSDENSSCAYAWDEQSPMAAGSTPSASGAVTVARMPRAIGASRGRETQSGAMAQSLFDLGNVLVHSTHFVGAHLR